MTPDKLESRCRIDENGCWIWTSYINPVTGYGAFSTAGWTFAAHRLSYELYVGEIPSGFHLHHRCGNRACINPDHLELLTPGDHVRHHRQTEACGICGSTRRKQQYRNGRPNGSYCLDCKARRQRERKARGETPA
jgi:hypothetical protein